MTTRPPTTREVLFEYCKLHGIRVARSFGRPGTIAGFFYDQLDAIKARLEALERPLYVKDSPGGRWTPAPMCGECGRIPVRAALEVCDGCAGRSVLGIAFGVEPGRVPSK